MEKFDFNVHKIGGAGLMQDRQSLTNLVQKVIKEGKGGVNIFVVSALAGITRLLGSLFKAIEYRQTKEIEEILTQFEKIHLNAIERLVLKDSTFFVKNFILLRKELEVFSFDSSLLTIKDHSHILTFGERYSSLIFNEFLKEVIDENSSLLDARDFIFCTGEDYLNSTLLLPETIKEIGIYFSKEKSNLIVTQGYIANDNRVLGYDGSDLTAAVITLALLKLNKTVSLTYWKDVLGVMVNPLNSEDGIFSNMKVAEYMAFSMSQSVPVRSDAIGLLVLSDKEKLQVSICSFKYLEGSGTVIRP